MSNIYEVIDGFGIEETQKNKLIVCLMKNREVREELFLALQSLQTKESKMSLLKDFISDEHQGQRPLSPSAESIRYKRTKILAEDWEKDTRKITLFARTAIDLDLNKE
ncbi:8448_t:CDS:2, partial [Funneliformis mosseae]